MAEYNPQDAALYRSENVNCSRTYASFRMWGPDVVPDEVTKLLGMEPTASRKVGDVRGKRTFDSGMWTLSSKALKTTDLEAHIEWLLDRIDAANASVRDLIASGRYKADIFCFWLSLTGHGGPMFSPQLMGRIAALGVPLGLDMYGADEILEPIEYEGKVHMRTV